jgi:hypothetical protein
MNIDAGLIGDVSSGDMFDQGAAESRIDGRCFRKSSRGA